MLFYIMKTPVASAWHVRMVSRREANLLYLRNEPSRKYVAHVESATPIGRVENRRVEKQSVASVLLLVCALARNS